MALANVTLLPPLTEDIGEHLSAYAESCILRRGLSEGSANHYRIVLGAMNGKLVALRLGASLLSLDGETNEDKTEALAIVLDRSGRRGKHLTPTTRNNYISTLVHFYAWAKKQRLCSFNWAEDLARPKVQRGTPHPVPETELARLLDFIGWQRPLRTWVMLGAFMGLRRAEIASLRYELIDWPGLRAEVIGKGNKTRHLPIHPVLAYELATYLYGPNLTGSIFKVQPNTVGGAIRSAMIKAGVDSSCHPLRHRFATQLYLGTHDIYAVKAALGHESVRTTEVYTQVDNEAVNKAVAALPAFPGLPVFLGSGTG